MNIEIDRPNLNSQNFPSHHACGFGLLLAPYNRNELLQGYLLPGVHGTYRRYFLELCIVAGLLLPWLGPVLGLAVLTPIVLLTVENGKVIDSTTDCFGGGTGPTTCPATSYFDYYFWNITNPNEASTYSWRPARCQLGHR